MATYLMMNESEFDPRAIGFPSLQGCVGIVLQTTTGLFGWHIFGAVDLATLTVMAPQFKTLINTTPNAGRQPREAVWRAVPPLSP